MLLTCSAIETVDPVDVCSQDEVPVGIDRDLNRAVPHLLFHVGERSAILTIYLCFLQITIDGAHGGEPLAIF